MQQGLATVLNAGDMLDHYRLEATVAHSGMSTLYKATDMNTGKLVAIKVPNAEMEADPVLLERFKREQEIGQELDHPGIVKTFDGEKRSRLYMVIEWVDGKLLRALLNEKQKLPVDRAELITLGICEALDYMHKHGVVHRDLKPENVMVDDVEPHQADRFRHCHEGGRAAADLCRSIADAGDAGLHFSGAGEGPARRPAQRHLRSGSNAVRDADGSAAVHRVKPAGGDE